MVSLDTMNKQINLRLPSKLVVSASSYAEKHGYSNLQDFIKESIREKLFEEPAISKNELILVKKLLRIINTKNLYGTEADLRKKLQKGR